MMKLSSVGWKVIGKYISFYKFVVESKMIRLIS